MNLDVKKEYYNVYVSLHKTRKICLVPPSKMLLFQDLTEKSLLDALPLSPLFVRVVVSLIRWVHYPLFSKSCSGRYLLSYPSIVVFPSLIFVHHETASIFARPWSNDSTMLSQSRKHFQRMFRKSPIRWFANMIFELFSEAQTSSYWIMNDSFVEFVGPVYYWCCYDLVVWC
jgi:hypothetical protein